jgi:hypothetical protein
MASARLPPVDLAAPGSCIMHHGSYQRPGLTWPGVNWVWGGGGGGGGLCVVGGGWWWWVERVEVDPSVTRTLVHSPV